MTKQNLSVKIEIPFGGFYHSIWDFGIDSEIEQTANWLAECSNFEVAECEISDIIFDHSDFAAMREKISESYATEFLHKFCLDGEFGYLSSPKFYNYSTDKIYCYISENQALSIAYNSLMNDEFANEFYTHCRKFFPHYYFGTPTQWLYDKNSEILLIVFFEFYFQWQIENDFSCSMNEFEFDIFEELRGNGVLSLNLSLSDDEILNIAKKEVA